uniref:Laminin IV type A domain-containing protein n=1 Tax=Anopheles melas TaxID=34690 RepID=A0A182TRW1_9DIPT
MEPLVHRDARDEFPRSILYQIVFFTMRAAISPLPAAWVLEKSMDGRAYDAWQYFAADDTECRERFGLPAYTANYIFKSDTEVICSTQFSSLDPLENGEINLSIISGRPSEMITSPELQNFTLARYVRIRLLRMQSAEAQCSVAHVETSSYTTLKGWTVTNLAMSEHIVPTKDNDTGFLVFGMFEMPETEAVYWKAPEGYLGNLLRSYGSQLTFKMDWITVRGDTSGKPTVGPSLILVGRNGMKIAYGEESYEETGGATITVPLKEDSWYHVPRTVKDIITRLRRTEYHGDPVTRSQFMAVLTDVEVVLLRGTYHTDQVESVLEQADLFSGSHSTTDSSATSSGFIELCECPEGYRGTSCEQCAFGYVRIYETSVTHERIGRCIPCSMCNGHAASCDLETGECGLCLHNTVGTNCERCLPGFYGNATLGRPDDCKRCACPLESPSNNFSPNCQSRGGSSDPSEYVCTQCPEGYTGDHCEFGNTEGWRCERCKTGYWGVPDDGCEPCSCSELGALENVCDVTTGQCICKPRYGGRRCDECDVGYGNLDLDCPACACNVNGSVSTVCNVVSGQCECNVGTEGIHCDRCREEFFGLSDEQPGACEAIEIVLGNIGIHQRNNSILGLAVDSHQR